jgi:5-methylcytosine-specific restriction endonuclease McrA
VARQSARSHAYRTLARIVRREEDICWLCGHPIDLTLPYRDPLTGRVNALSWSLDHVVPVARGGPTVDRANARAAHYGCNSARGDGAPRGQARNQPQRAALITSRDW